MVGIGRSIVGEAHAVGDAVEARAQLRGDLAARIRVATDREKAEQERLQKTADFKEGVRAMAERRTPNFQAG